MNPMFERCLYFNVNALARAVERVWAEAFRPFDLSPAHAYVLRTVLAEPGRRQQDLAATLRLSRSTVTRFVQALEGKGLLYRSGSEADRREQRVYPTATAIALRDDLEKTGNTLYARMRESVGPDALPALVAELRRAAHHLEGIA